MKTRSSSRLAPGFRNQPGQSSDGFTLIKVMPKKSDPVFARPGMAVELMSDHGDAGVILDVMPDVAIVRNARGETLALQWWEVALTNVQPDPAAIRQCVA